ncbi:sensor histidine kinase [Paenibacillus thalictri]|uniref:Sensor histidine kinase n=1 Tax=Paenibacillus thalictri TaxID=2527873 RepID=A0A4Q9DUV9_9BACL|nr:sensor histidine kinase [Paenibacillus thalictri]TBL79358.1 sensor histidine kinase [Paenibacillus thalictri]
MNKTAAASGIMEVYRAMTERISRKIRFRTVQSKIFTLVFVCLIIPFGITFYYSFNSLKEIITDKIGTSVQESLHLTQSNMEEVLGQMMSAAMLVSIDQPVARVLESPGEMSQYERLKITDDMIFKLNSTYLYKMRFYTAIMDAQGQLYSSLENQAKKEIIQNFAWLPEAKAANNQFLWVYEESNLISANKKEPTLIVAKSISSADGRRNIGVVMIFLGVNELGPTLNTLDGTMVLSDANGKVLYRSKGMQLSNLSSDEPVTRRMADSSQGQFIEDIDGQRYIVNYRTIALTGWKIAQFRPYEAVFKEMVDLQKVYLYVIGGILIVFILIAGTIAYGVTRSLRLLRLKMVKVDKGNLHAAAVAVRGTDEIAELMSTYNGMLEQIKELIQNVKEEQKQKEHLRFKMLQAQINPHFLLNTLNNIKWMAYMRRDQEVGDMISHMAVMMEASIGRGEDVIALRQEIEYIQSYVTLQNIRWNGQIELRTDIPDRLLACAIVKFTLQPLVENSIIHGRGQGRNEAQTIDIVCEEEQDHVTLIVRDNGTGVPDNKLRVIKETLAEPQLYRNRERVGLLNVHERIKLHFGDAFGIAVNSAVGEGTAVTVTLPKLLPDGGTHV